MPKFLLVGGASVNNRGCEAQLVITIQELLKRFPGSSFELLNIKGEFNRQIRITNRTIRAIFNNMVFFL